MTAGAIYIVGPAHSEDIRYVTQTTFMLYRPFLTDTVLKCSVNPSLCGHIFCVDLHSAPSQV